MIFLIVSTIISAVVSNFILFDFMNLIFERKYNRSYKTIFFVMTIIMMIINYFGLILLNYIWSLLTIIILTRFLYQSKSKNIYIITSLYFILLILLETITAIIFDIVLPNSSLKYYFGMILSAFVLLILQMFLRKVFLYKLNVSIKFIEFIDIMIIMFSFIAVFMIYFVLQEVTTLNMKFYLFFISVGFIFLDIYIIYFLKEKEKILN